MRSLLLAALLVASVTAPALAQVDLQTMKARLRTTEQKREFLRTRMLIEISDADRLETMTTKLDAMDDRQVDALLDHYFLTTEQNQARELAAAKDELARATAERDELARRLAGGRSGGVGFAPVITTLPSGTSLGAGAVVSPDRRYVRINAAPFFSQVGPVQTFNMANGQTGYYPPPSYYPYQTGYGYPNYGYQNPGYGYPNNNSYYSPNYTYNTPNYNNRQQDNSGKIKAYHDGLRTRYKRK